MTKQDIWKNTRPNNDFAYIMLHHEDNMRRSDLHLQNYRHVAFTRNPDYYFPDNHKLYDLQNINDGKGAGNNPNLDSALQRVHIQTKPADKLSEAVEYVRYVDFLPVNTIEPEWDHDRFLVSTTIPIDPQNRIQPQFDFYGVNCRNYNRMSDVYYRKLGDQNSKFRKRSKYYR